MLLLMMTMMIPDDVGDDNDGDDCNNVACDYFCYYGEDADDYNMKDGGDDYTNPKMTMIVILVMITIPTIPNVLTWG